MAKDDEKHWFGFGGWQSLRGSIKAMAREELPGLLADLSTENAQVEAATNAFVIRIVRKMEARLQARGSSKWSYGISLLGEVDILAARIKADPILGGNAERRNLPPEIAFYRLFSHFLEHARQGQGGVSRHRVLTWERLDRISRRIAEEQAKKGLAINRFSAEHFRQIQEKCLAEWPESNVDLKIETIRGYFEEFCDDAQGELPEEDRAGPADYDYMAREFQKKPNVRMCIERVQRKDEALWDALLLKHGCHPILHGPFYDYASSHDISRYEIDKRYTTALSMVQQCIETWRQFTYGVRT
jgi:hypothetical protein